MIIRLGEPVMNRCPQRARQESTGFDWVGVWLGFVPKKLRGTGIGI